ncbi:SMC-Scp complex subunit ScpB [Martelella alba]|uniref:SMC-Scp complex subunit ScpB n=1 Tax=Martelella alba TaxID=2590451 RepID=A0A506U7A3_9HYPH|nr:SMC-Scp complex subunit ScpB [Martelella alba]TPW29226.1 SMC-Scp complex subunit ScpB [Martelella alba]
MANTGSARPARRRSRTDRQERLFDRELQHLPQALRWREWMQRVEAVIFAASEPVPRDVLSPLVGTACSIDLLIDDLNTELADRPYELVFVAGGWQHRTRPRFADAIRAATVPTRSATAALSEYETTVLAAIGYLQPITRSQLSAIFGREVSRDTIGSLRGAGMITSGPRSPTPGAPYTYVTTMQFLSAFGMESLRELPDIEALNDAGLLQNETVPVEADIPVDPLDE